MPVGDRTHSNALTPGVRGAAGGYEGSRCRDCEGYPDPTEPRCDCTTTGRRRPGYGKTCDKKVLRPVPLQVPRVRHCATPGCLNPIASKHAETSYCPDCARKVRSFRINPSKKAAQPHREERVVSNTVTAWTPEEDSIIKAHAHKGKRAIAELMVGRRSPTAVQQRASKLGISLAMLAVESTPPLATPPEAPAMQPDRVAVNEAAKPTAAEIASARAEADRLEKAGDIEGAMIADQFADELWDKADAPATHRETRDDLLHDAVDNILRGEAAVTITIADASADRENIMRRELIDTHLCLIEELARTGDGLDAVYTSARRVRDLMKAL